MVSVTEELGFSFGLVLINFDLDSHMRLMAALGAGAGLEENHARCQNRARGRHR